jgi:beta-glucosidase
VPHTIPSDLVLGVSTSAHQVEGGDTNSDWWAFEREPGRIRSGDTADRAVDFWNRYADDVACMRTHGIQAHRISVSWARIEPEEGRIDEAALDRYLSIVQEHRDASIRVAVTLLHFALPRWLAARGGILAADAPSRFRDFVRVVARKLRGCVWQWHTVNEPLIHADGAYRRGVWPPGEKNIARFVHATRALLRLHVAAYRSVHEVDDAPTGLVHNFLSARPRRPTSRLDGLAARACAWVMDDSIVDSLTTGRIPFPWGVGDEVDGLRGSADLIGVNYYNGVTVTLGGWPIIREGTPTDRRTQMGWVACPVGLSDVLRSASQLGRPIYVTENGIATDDETWRIAFIRDHLKQVVAAREQGIDVRGYLHWSWIDNFEWAEGLAPRFGLVGVDPETLERLPKPSLAFYSSLARTRVLPDSAEAPSTTRS